MRRALLPRGGEVKQAGGGISMWRGRVISYTPSSVTPPSTNWGVSLQTARKWATSTTHDGWVVGSSTADAPRLARAPSTRNLGPSMAKGGKGPLEGGRATSPAVAYPIRYVQWLRTPNHNRTVMACLPNHRRLLLVGMPVACHARMV